MGPRRSPPPVPRRSPGVIRRVEGLRRRPHAAAPDGGRDRRLPQHVGGTALALDIGDPTIAAVEEMLDGGPDARRVVGQDHARRDRAVATGQASMIGLHQDEPGGIDPFPPLARRDGARHDRHRVGAVLGEDLEGEAFAGRGVVTGDHDHAVAVPACLILEAGRDLAVDGVVEVRDEQAERRGMPHPEAASGGVRHVLELGGGGLDHLARGDADPGSSASARDAVESDTLAAAATSRSSTRRRRSGTFAVVTAAPRSARRRADGGAAVARRSGEPERLRSVCPSKRARSCSFDHATGCTANVASGPRARQPLRPGPTGCRSIIRPGCGAGPRGGRPRPRMDRPIPNAVGCTARCPTSRRSRSIERRRPTPGSG